MFLSRQIWTRSGKNSNPTDSLFFVLAIPLVIYSPPLASSPERIPLAISIVLRAPYFHAPPARPPPPVQPPSTGAASLRRRCLPRWRCLPPPAVPLLVAWLMLLLALLCSKKLLLLKDGNGSGSDRVESPCTQNRNPKSKPEP